MSHALTVWRAAQLVGVARGVLQQRVRDGELELSDGLISTDELLRLYPSAQFEESGLLERVTQIKNEAFGKRVRERLLPSQEVLAQRLFGQSLELADVRRHVQRYHSLVLALQDRMRTLDGVGNAELRELGIFLNQGLARILASDPGSVLEGADDMMKVIAAHVTLRPSGHEFRVEGRDSLLQAGLRAGLKLNYGCGNGSCGMCKVRVVSGAVAKCLPFDYPLSEAEKRQGYTLLCAHAAASSELTLEVLEASEPKDIPEQEIVAQVRAVTELAPDTRLLHLQTPRSHRLRFLAGQSLSLGWAGAADDDCRASYAIASCPCDDRNLHFYIPRNARDAFATRLFAGRIKGGASIVTQGPFGDFVLADGHRPLVFVACDTGFAPVKSLIEHAIALDDAPSLTLFWLATRRDGHFLSKHCRAWEQALDQFHYHLSSDNDARSGAQAIARVIGAEPLRSSADYYIAGPAEFVQSIHEQLLGYGLAAEQVFATVIADSGSASHQSSKCADQP